MVKFPTPSEVAAMQAEDQKKVVALVDRFIEFIRPALATARKSGDDEILVQVPPGLLKPGEKWNRNHDEELKRRIRDAGWWITGRFYIDEEVKRSSFYIKPAQTEA